MDNETKLTQKINESEANSTNLEQSEVEEPKRMTYEEMCKRLDEIGKQQRKITRYLNANYPVKENNEKEILALINKLQKRVAELDRKAKSSRSRKK